MKNVCKAVLGFVKKIYFELNIVLFKKWAIPGLFFVFFRIFKQTLQFLQQIHVKNVHPVNGAGIRTHNFRTWVSFHNR